MDNPRSLVVESRLATRLERWSILAAIVIVGFLPLLAYYLLVAGVPTVYPDELNLGSPYRLILDIRDANAFAAGHIPGAINVLGPGRPVGPCPMG